MKSDNRQDLANEIRSIGYSDNVEIAGRSFHVQTDVTTSNNVKVKTIVIEAGVVLDATVTVDEQVEGDVVARTRQAAKLQHDRAVAEVRAGKYG